MTLISLTDPNLPHPNTSFVRETYNAIVAILGEDAVNNHRYDGGYDTNDNNFGLVTAITNHRNKNELDDGEEEEEPEEKLFDKVEDDMKVEEEEEKVSSLVGK